MGAKQRVYFPAIEDELQRHGCKIGHWAWWVLPSELECPSEALPATSVGPGEAQALLVAVDLAAWGRILRKLTELQMRSPVAEVLPSIDAERVEHFCRFWLA